MDQKYCEFCFCFLHWLKMHPRYLPVSVGHEAKPSVAGSSAESLWVALQVSARLPDSLEPFFLVLSLAHLVVGQLQIQSPAVIGLRFSCWLIGRGCSQPCEAPGVSSWPRHLTAKQFKTSKRISPWCTLQNPFSVCFHLWKPVVSKTVCVCSSARGETGHGLRRTSFLCCAPSPHGG